MTPPITREEIIATVRKIKGNKFLSQEDLNSAIAYLKKNNKKVLKKAHITDGDKCWCNPTIIKTSGSDVILHNEVEE